MKRRAGLLAAVGTALALSLTGCTNYYEVCASLPAPTATELKASNEGAEVERTASPGTWSQTDCVLEDGTWQPDTD